MLHAYGYGRMLDPKTKTSRQLRANLGNQVPPQSRNGGQCTHRLLREKALVLIAYGFHVKLL